MLRRISLVLTVVLALIAYGTPANAQPPFQPGAPGIGDPYFPLDGNGGYDVQHYLLDVTYTRRPTGWPASPTITARATQNLSAFNLDFDGLTVRSITRQRPAAAWSRSGGELTVTPRQGLRRAQHVHDGRALRRRARDRRGPTGRPASSTPTTARSSSASRTSPSTWFPVNDHPSDKAAYTFAMTVPAGLEAVSNGVLASRRTQRRLDHVDVGRHGADGLLPGHRDGRRSSTCARTARTASSYWDAHRPRPVHRRRAAHRRPSCAVSPDRPTWRTSG